jgi:hypothetical protein
MNLKPHCLVALLLAVAFGESQSKASDTTIYWHVVGYDGPPITTFALAPPNPTTTNFITFIAPTDGSNYINDCFASYFNGYPHISVDPTNHAINVTFSGHPELCSAVVSPVSGVEGHVGPLAGGFWSVIIPGRLPQPPAYYWFNVDTVPLSLSLQASAGTSPLELFWPVSGDAYALEATDNPRSGTWQVVTNSPTISSNRNTLQISADADARFFRLRRL